MGFQAGGAAQEYFALPAVNVLKLADDLSLDEAAMIEPLAVTVHALRRGGDIVGKKVLVLGAGPIGNLTAQVAKLLGADEVMITDVSAYKVSKALECGIDHVVNTRQKNLSEAINTYFGPTKADLILECVGVEETMTDAILNARKGTSIVVVGVFGKKPQVNLGLVQDRELSLIGTLMYQQTDYETAIQLVASRKLKLAEMITHRFAFDHYLDAYHMIETSKGEYLKVMIDLPESGV